MCAARDAERTGIAANRASAARADWPEAVDRPRDATEMEALDLAAQPVRDVLLGHVHEQDLKLFVDLSDAAVRSRQGRSKGRIAPSHRPTAFDSAPGS